MRAARELRMIMSALKLRCWTLLSVVASVAASVPAADVGEGTLCTEGGGGGVGDEIGDGSSCTGTAHYCAGSGVRYDEDFDPRELSGWLRRQTKKINTFCPDDDEDDDDVIDDGDEESAFRVSSPPRKCAGDEESGWGGSVDKEGMPKGPGRMDKSRRKGRDEDAGKKLIGDGKPPKKCVDLSPGVSHFVGRFSPSSGVADGPGGRTVLEWDGSSLSGRVSRGSHVGRTVGADARGGVRFVGRYRAGRPDGPGWVFPPGSGDDDAGGFVFAWFKDGEILEDKVALLSPDAESVTVGRLVNGTFLSHPEEVKVRRMGELSCVKAIDIGGAEVVRLWRRKMLRLPAVVRAMPERGAVLVRSGRALVFNRVAKTGSQSIIELMVQLGRLPAYVDIRTREELRQPANQVASFVSQVDSGAATGAGAWVRHYNFADFERMGARWTPVHINIVRHPVDRIISWFYYWRAAWNIVERKLAYPSEPLPDPDFLRKDFDGCVLRGDPECTYEQGADAARFPDHRSQVMAFCGHEDFCAEFNSERAMQRAKENVERYYSVVGVLEEMNKTLSVLEMELPEIFAGASELYHAHPEIRRKMNRNAYKLPAREETLQRVRANFTREIEFYEFVRKRLDEQNHQLSQLSDE